MQTRKAPEPGLEPGLAPDPPPTLRPPAWRRDYIMASTVERGLALQLAAGVSVAAQYMYERGVPFEIVHRTLIAGVCRSNDLGTPFVPRRYVMPTPLIYSHSHAGPQYLRSRKFHAALKARQRGSVPEARSNKAMAAPSYSGSAPALAPACASAASAPHNVLRRLRETILPCIVFIL